MFFIKNDRKKVLLVEPPFYRLYRDAYSLTRYPLSLGYLAGAIRKATDWDAAAYNADFSPSDEPKKICYLVGDGFANYLDNLKDLSGEVWQQISATISRHKPSVVGISAKSQNFTSARAVARKVKEIDERIIVVVGGPHPSMIGREVLNCPDIDIAVIGEGEATIVELLDAMASDGDLSRVKGIIYRDNAKNIKETPPRDFIDNLDSLPFPHESAPEVLCNYDEYPNTAFQYIFAIRGCPFNCFYCGSRNIWEHKVRFRSPENVMREIKGLQSKGLEMIHFDDDTFGIKKEYIQNLCATLARECPGIKWSCELHVNLVDEETISMMKSSGCYSIRIGIESGSNKILKEMRKNTTIEEALSACKIIKRHGIELRTFFMIGFPQETEDTLKATVEAMEKTECDALIYSIFTPYPGTEAFEFCKERGLVNDSYDVSLYNHQSPVNCFSINIPPDRFRALAAEVEEIVDRKAAMNVVM